MSSSPSDTASRRIGTWVRGKYRLDAVLGEGGMAIVYAATHRNKKRFAVKMLRGDLRSTDAPRRFLREGYVANSVGHDGAVEVIDDDLADDGSAFLVMELLEGANVDMLAQRSPGRVLAPRVVLQIAYQLLDVLAAAHAKGIVHRDVKPANLFITRDGRLKVLDFGIARIREFAESMATTKTGVTLGTPCYMAPEQARGKPGLVKEPTDIWAVGATMFTLLSDTHVHEGESMQDLVITAATAKARSLATVTQAPEPLVALVDRALAFDPADRWPSATAMRDAIAELHQSLFESPMPSHVEVTDQISLLPSDPSHRIDSEEASSAPTLADNLRTQRIAGPTADVWSNKSREMSVGLSTGEPVSHPTSADQRRGRFLFAIVASFVVAAGIAATVVVMRAKRPEQPPRQAEPPTAATVTASASATPIASETAQPVASATASASSPRAKPRVPQGHPTTATPTPKPSDWDHQ
jgi:serine/threonine-protein kinase